MGLVECIIRPDVGRPSTTTSINHVLQAGRNTLKELDTEIQSGQDESSRLETSREYLQQLLDGDQLTELYVGFTLGSSFGESVNSSLEFWTLLILSVHLLASSSFLQISLRTETSTQVSPLAHLPVAINWALSRG